MPDPVTTEITLWELLAALFTGPGILLGGQIAWHKISIAWKSGRREERLDQHSRELDNLKCKMEGKNGTRKFISPDECRRRREDTTTHINELEQKVIDRINVFENNVNKRMDALEERQQRVEDYIMKQKKPT